MTTTITPPPAVPPPGHPRASARIIALLAIVLGALLVLGTAVSAAFALARVSARTLQTMTTDATGIRGLDIDVSDAELRIVYAGDEVTLEVYGNADDWRLERDEDELSVMTARGWFGSAWFGEGDRATLTLPASLERSALDADLSVSAGALFTSGSYGELDLDLSAGSLQVLGSARSLDAEVSAGRLTFDLADVSEAEVRLSAGAVEGALTGSAPAQVTADVSAGRLDLTLPEGTYAVESDLSVGKFENRLSVDPASARRVTVSVSAGFAVLRS